MSAATVVLTPNECSRPKTRIKVVLMRDEIKLGEEKKERDRKSFALNTELKLVLKRWKETR